MVLRFIYVLILHSFFLLIDICFFFQLLTTIKKIYPHFWINLFVDLFSHFSWFILSIEIAGLKGKHVFKIIRNYQTFFQSECSSFYPHQQCMRIPVPYDLPKICIVNLLCLATFKIFWWHLIVHLIYIFLNTHEVEYLLICLSVIWIFSLWVYG